MSNQYKAYNQMLSARDSEFRLKPAGDKMTLVTTEKRLIKRDVPLDTLHLFIEGVLLEEFGAPVAVQPVEPARRMSNSSSQSSHSGSGDDLITGLIIGGLFL